MERMMKLQDVLLKAMAKRIIWWAAEIIGVTDRSMRRWRERLERDGYAGLADRRQRRPLPGMLLHIDGSKHRWFQDDRWYDLLVILDDASSEIYYAQLVEEESTRTVMAGLREVIETRGLFCALYSDRGSHFFVTPKAGEKVDKHRLTQVGRALKELGGQMIPAYSPQARGRSERNFGTWQGRLPQELRLAGIGSVEQANRFLRERYIAEFNRMFAVPAADKGTAFRRCSRTDLNWIFTVQTDRVVAQDNTVAIGDRRWQLERTRFRHTLAGCTVTIHEHLDGRVSVRWGPHVVGRFAADGAPLGGKTTKKPKSCGKVEISPTTRDSHFPTATTTTIASLSPNKTSKKAA
jgi:hypothetical protein